MGHQVVSLKNMYVLACGMAGSILAVGIADASESGSARCAVYGPGFSAVAGSDTCIRIGGRVRVEAGNGTMSSNTGWANSGIVSAGAAPFQPERRHLRINELNTGSLDPFKQ